ncbi:transmembrane protein, putative [Bodo saltans]|uniref:Transmembrane protein, putative n=1 Tax=Bodo saltans TaxID=75058 RepID=A0A0S4JPE5_BODSA|nr:transmembrane protein, putative [Bodo saltans]|eukprot:CUG91152.1 transmembrane protein, putative [Bodo saltans]
MTSSSPSEPLTGSANAGGSSFITDQSASSGFFSALNFFREYGGREEHSFFNTRGTDNQHKPPSWMEHKDVSVDGTPLTREQRQAPGYWEKVYEKELAIGEAIAKTKRSKRFEYDNSVMMYANNVLRSLKLAAPLSEQRAIDEKLTELAEAEEYEKVVNSIVDRKNAAGGANISDAWEALIVSVDSNRPTAKVAREYRPKVDFFGIDPFLDSTPSFIWFSTKIGMYIGMALGTAKTFSVVNVDAQFLRASGVGIVSLLNITVLANVIKWGGNLCLFSTAFCVGDRLAKYTKKFMYPQHDANQRSTINYVAGLSFSCATLGTLPWWVLNDKRFAVRLAASGMFIGGCLGVFVGYAMERLVAMNLGRLDAGARDLRRYEALMRRESIWKEHLAQKYSSDNASASWF